jgi:predicted nucleic acid-binding protein
MLLDTCVLVDLLRPQQKAAGYLRTQATRPAVSVVTLTELIAGANSRKEELLIDKIMGSMLILPVTEIIARRAGQWLKHYKPSHGVEVPDALIAATAEEHRLPLATLNLKHFPMFPKLKAAY